MRAFNVAFLTINLILLALVLYLHFETRSRDRERFERLKPILTRVYADFNMALPYRDPKNLDELLAPLDALTRGLSK